MIDCHSHIIYGVDDGSRSLQESKLMLEAAREAGIDEIVATPHFRKRIPDMVLLHAHYKEILTLAEAENIKLSLGAEMHWSIIEDTNPDVLREYCREGTNELLVEFHMRGDMPNDMQRGLKNIQRAGIKIVIAHPERYEFVQKDISIAALWRDMGCVLQMDATELLRSPFDKSRRTAKRLLEGNYYEYYASDAHCENDYKLFTKAMSKIRNIAV